MVQKIVSDLSALNDTASEMIVKAETFARHTYTTEEARAASALESAQGAHGLAMRARYNVSSQRNTSLYLQQLLLETDRNFSANNVEFTRQDRRIGSIASVLLDVHGLLNETKVNWTRFFLFVLIFLGTPLLPRVPNDLFVNTQWFALNPQRFKWQNIWQPCWCTQRLWRHIQTKNLEWCWIEK